ncbi:flagellar motor protein MotB [Polaribacter sp. BAL334]|uniref:flagellar motor protein MotB n=1 Tax=Polaribacter sp. BAL334 TaxID=1708178 RepID=UPI0018D22F1B|nr:flagellar motor protein MotB [Polaribacter sp. BAL334]MBG7613171.1 flagellar motor protein MotB [Polaribacter sp. BAL334]
MKKSGFFWVSYADLMTSLFFIMLVLYVISFAILQTKQNTLEVQANQLKEIKDIQKAIENLDNTYYHFDTVNKRYKLNIDVRFKSNSSNIIDIPLSTRINLAKAGKNLFNKVKSIIDTSKTIDYLLIIEGNAQRSNNNWVSNPNMGYNLSYNRALSLFNYWKEIGADFNSLGTQCEVILAGSGYFSHSRDEEDENNNRRFTIQVTSKVGKFLNDIENNKDLKSQANKTSQKKIFK